MGVLRKQLTIGIVCDDSLDKPDGVQQYVLTLGAWLAEQGHSVHYITSGSEQVLLPNLHSIGGNIAVRFNGNRLRVPLPIKSAALNDLFDSVRFDVLHVQMPYSPLLAGRVISQAAKNTAVVGTFHIFPHSRSVSQGARLLRLLLARSLPRFDDVISVSAPAQDFALARFGVSSEVIPNMVDVKRFQSASIPTRSRGLVHIVFLGRLVERKGSMQLLMALSYLIEHKLANNAFRVSIGGRGPLQPKLQDYIKTRSLSDVVALGGFVAEEDKPSFLAGADIACFPSTGGESFGISLIEAMAATHGVVVAGDNPGYRSVMGVATDQLVDPNDTPAFAQLLAGYINDPTKRAEAHAWQTKHVRQFDKKIVGQRILGVYEQSLRMKQQ